MKNECYDVLPDITEKKTVYLVVRVLERNEDGLITKFEIVDRKDEAKDAQNMADQLNS